MEDKSVKAASIQDKLTYAGLVLLAFELMKNLIVDPIKTFYYRTTFSAASPFKTYDADVRSRHKNEFEACLLYLRDFMEAIDGSDFDIIQEVRKKRNEIAHELSSIIESFRYAEFSELLSKARKVLFKISNYRVKMEIGADPEAQNRGIDWETVVGSEYFMFDKIMGEINQATRRITNGST